MLFALGVMFSLVAILWATTASSSPITTYRYYSDGNASFDTVWGTGGVAWRESNSIDVQYQNQGDCLDLWYHENSTGANTGQAHACGNNLTTLADSLTGTAYAHCSYHHPPGGDNSYPKSPIQCYGFYH
jgi:hypothetical protein